MIPIVKGIGSAITTVADGMVQAARVASDVTSILDSSRLATLQSRNASGATLFHSALTEAELKEMTDLESKEAGRIKFYNDMANSIKATRTAVTSLSQADTQATDNKKEELASQRKELVNDQKAYQYDLQTFKAEQFDKEMDQSKKQNAARMRLESENVLDLAKTKKDRVDEAIKSVVRTTPPPKSGDVKANYDKVAGLAGPEFAHAWLYDWELHGLKPETMPPLPEASDKGKSAGPGSPPTAPTISTDTGEKPSTLTPTSIKTAEPKPVNDNVALAQIIGEAVASAMAAMSKSDKPVEVHIHIDPEGMKHVITTTINEQAHR